MTPITILTGFLGSGKTTLLNQILKQNPEIRFGLIINEFGEIGIDGQIIEDSGEEMVEISNGCVCCVVRKDLQDTVKKLLDSKKVQYIIVEASGLAEPAPVAQTFSMDDFEGAVNLDSVICLVDALNYGLVEKDYRIALEQLAFADIIVLNKVNEASPEQLEKLRELIQKINPEATLLENQNDLNTKLLIDTGAWSIDKLTAADSTSDSDSKVDLDHDHDDHDSKHTHHHDHEHEQVDEVVFTSTKTLDPNKLDMWLQTKFPKNVIRAKGFLNLQTPTGENLYLFQMVGAGKTLKPFIPTRKDFDYQTSRIVLIGKDLDKNQILGDLAETLV